MEEEGGEKVKVVARVEEVRVTVGSAAVDLAVGARAAAAMAVEGAR